ncbi:MAG: enoyl-CoA hydratase-related protein [Candidatus Hodarchaeota archaeon]
MSYQTLSFERNDHIGIIDINGPLDCQVKIAQLSDDFVELLAEIAWKNQTRVIVLTGSGNRPFSVSSDLIKEVCKISEQRGIGFRSLAEPIARLDRPVIAAIKGDAIGQGLELALACDLRIATEASHFDLLGQGVMCLVDIPSVSTKNG